MITGPNDLCNVSEDTGETKNLAKQYPEVVAKAERLFKEAHAPSERWWHNYKFHNRNRAESRCRRVNYRDGPKSSGRQQPQRRHQNPGSVSQAQAH